MDESRLTDGCTVGINNILLTVLGFVVGLALSFRSSTAYERYIFVIIGLGHKTY